MGDATSPPPKRPTPPPKPSSLSPRGPTPPPKPSSPTPMAEKPSSPTPMAETPASPPPKKHYTPTYPLPEKPPSPTPTTPSPETVSSPKTTSSPLSEKPSSPLSEEPSSPTSTTSSEKPTSPPPKKPSYPPPKPMGPPSLLLSPQSFPGPGGESGSLSPPRKGDEICGGLRRGSTPCPEVGLLEGAEMGRLTPPPGGSYTGKKIPQRRSRGSSVSGESSSPCPELTIIGGGGDGKLTPPPGKSSRGSKKGSRRGSSPFSGLGGRSSPNSSDGGHSPRFLSPRSPRDWDRQPIGTYPILPPLPLKEFVPLKVMRRDHLKHQEEIAKKEELDSAKMDKAHQAELGSRERHYSRDLELLKKEADTQKIHMVDHTHVSEMKKLTRDFEESEKLALADKKGSLKIEAKERAEKTKEAVKEAKVNFGKDKHMYKKKRADIEGEAKVRQRQHEEKELNRVSVEVKMQLLSTKKELLLKQLKEVHNSDLQSLYRIFGLGRTNRDETHKLREKIVVDVYQHREDMNKTKQELEGQHLEKEIELAKQLLVSQQFDEATALEKELENHTKSQMKELSKYKKQQQKLFDEEIKKLKKEKKKSETLKSEVSSKTAEHTEAIEKYTTEFKENLATYKDAKRTEMENRHKEETANTNHAFKVMGGTMRNDQIMVNTSIKKAKEDELSALDRQHHTEFGALIEGQAKELREAWETYTQNRKVLLHQLQSEKMGATEHSYQERSQLFETHLENLKEDLYCVVTKEDTQRVEDMKKECAMNIERVGKANEQESSDLVKIEEKEADSLSQLLKADVGNVKFFESMLIV